MSKRAEAGRQADVLVVARVVYDIFLDGISEIIKSPPLLLFLLYFFFSRKPDELIP